MKVAFFIGGLNRGGAETLVLDTFQKKDVSLFESILIYRNEGNLSAEYRATGVPMFRIKPRGRKIGYISQLRKLLRDEKVDILHTQTLLNAFLGLFCVCFLRTKLVASFHGLFPSMKYRFLFHPVMWFSNASLFVSDYVRKWYIQHTRFAPKHRCHIVYNGVDFAKLDKQYIVPDFLAQTDPLSVKLAMVGSFVDGRSQDFLCRCLQRLCDDGTDNFQFFFVGRRSEDEPERYDKCVSFCREHDMLDRVHFVGGRSDVPAILQHIDGFVYSSDHDTFGIAVVEAIAAGVPVLVNDWDVMKEITDNGKTATLYDTKNVESCVEKMKDLIENPGRHKRAALSHAQVIREQFSIERHIRRLFEIYQLVLA